MSLACTRVFRSADTRVGDLMGHRKSIEGGKIGIVNASADILAEREGPQLIGHHTRRS
jgi:hypothetical protein